MRLPAPPARAWFAVASPTGRASVDVYADTPVDRRVFRATDDQRILELRVGNACDLFQASEHALHEGGGRIAYPASSAVKRKATDLPHSRRSRTRRRSAWSEQQSAADLEWDHSHCR